MLALTASDVVLDLGCGSGSMLNLLVQRSACRGIGIDLLDRSLFLNTCDSVSYIEADMTEIWQFNLQPTVTLCVDSLYFIQQSDDLLRYLYGIPGNRMFLFYSQYLFEPGESKNRLSADGTILAKTLRRNGIPYMAVDFSANEQRLYNRAIMALERLQSAFEREGNLDLLEQKKREDLLGKQLYEEGRASRFLYVIPPSFPAEHKNLNRRGNRNDTRD